MMKSYQYAGAFIIIGLATLQVTAESFSAVAEIQIKVNQRVQFATGKSSKTIKGSVPLGRKDTYIFRARKGQTILVDVTWEGERVGGNEEQGLSGFTFVQPGGQTFEDPQDNQFTATATGDYRVIIAQPYKLTSPRYTFKLTIR